MHGRKKSDLPQTKEEKDAVRAKISNYKKASTTYDMHTRTFPTIFGTPAETGRTAGPSSNRSRFATF